VSNHILNTTMMYFIMLSNLIHLAYIRICCFKI
jgi:hypothetical protein